MASGKLLNHWLVMRARLQVEYSPSSVPPLCIWGMLVFLFYFKGFVLGQHTDPGNLTEAIIPGQCPSSLWRGLWIGGSDTPLHRTQPHCFHATHLCRLMAMFVHAGVSRQVNSSATTLLM